jgi:hypothetical protein
MALILIKAVQKVYPDMDEWDCRALYYTGTSASSLPDLKNRSEKVTG